MNAREFFDHVQKGPLLPAYLLAGEEGYFIERALSRLMEKGLSGAPREFNLDVFYAKDAKADAVAARADTLPMMAERRVVVLKEADKLRDVGPIKGYLASPAPSTVLVLVAENADRSKEKTLSQAVSTHGAAVHFYHPYENELPRHVSMIAKEAGYEIEDAACAYLKEALGGNLALIESELNKVFNFLGGRRKVTYADVKDSVGDFGLPLVFELIDAAAERRTGEALRVLSKLLQDGEQPLMLLGMMAGHWRRLMAARERTEKGDAQDKIAREFRLNNMNRKAFLGQVSRLSVEELRRAFGLFRQADMALKGSAVAPGMVIERLVLDLASTPSSRRGPC